MRTPPGIGHLLLGQPELAELYMRALALKGELPSFSGSEFLPIIQLLDLTDIEYRFLRREQLYQGGALQGALAANFNYITLGLIGTGRGVAVVDQIILVNTSAGAQRFTIYMHSNAVIGSAGGLVSSRDDRQNKGVQLSRAGMFGVGSSQDPGDLGGSIFGAIHILVPAGQSLVYPCNYVLTANTDSSNGQPVRLSVQTTTANVSSGAFMTWRERAAPVSSELS